MTPAITPQALYELLKKRQQVTLVDVRPSTEHTQWSLYDSICIPASDIDHKLVKLPKNHPIVVFCNLGNDSRVATDKLVKRGFDAVSLTGGLKAWNSIYDVATVLDKRSTLTVYQMKRLGKGCLSYLIVLPDKKSTIIVDPAYNADAYADLIKTRELKPIAVLDTHIHADHISGARILAKQYHIPYLLPKKSIVNFAFKPMEDVLPNLVTDATVTIIPTPGHTPESIALFLDDTFLLTGDTLFIDAIGRCDLEGDIEAKTKQLYTSLTTLMKLPENIQVLPAHTAQPLMPGAARSANMRYITLFNPLANMTSENDFIKFQKDNHSTTPMNFESITLINNGKKSVPKNIEDLEFGPNSCALNVPEEE